MRTPFLVQTFAAPKDSSLHFVPLRMTRGTPEAIALFVTLSEAKGLLPVWAPDSQKILRWRSE